MRSGIVYILICLATATAFAKDAGNAPLAPGISVIGIAAVPARPDTVEVSATLSAEGEMASDARVKERASRQRLVESLKAKWPTVTVAFKGISIVPVPDPSSMLRQQQQQMMMINGIVQNVQQNLPDMNRRVSVTEPVRLILGDADKLDAQKLAETVTRMIDTLRDNAAQLGPPAPGSPILNANAPALPAGPLVVCKVANPAALRTAAYKAAMDDARQKASALAELAGAKTGKVLAIRELELTGDGSLSPANSDGAIASTVVGDISVNVRLAVQFEIVRQ